MLRSLVNNSVWRAATRSPLSAFSSRLLSTLTLIEHNGGVVAPAALSALTAAKELGGPITALVAGSDGKAAAEQAAKVDGVEKVLLAAAVAYDHGLPEPTAALVAETVKKNGFTHVVAPSSAFGRNVIPRAAALLDTQPVTDVVKIEGEDTFVRPIYAGNALATVKDTEPIKILTVRGTAFPAAETSGNSAAVEDADNIDPKQLSTFVSEDITKSERPDLSTANKVVSGGRGLKSKEQFEEIMYPLADSIGAAVGASRAAVDSGFCDNSLQVGQTGKVVAPELYLAVGISGAIQHLAGMKDSKVIAAINKDAEAPIFHVSDLGIVTDLFEAVPKLTEELKK